MVEVATLARGSKASRDMFDSIAFSCCSANASFKDEEMEEVYKKYKKERDNMDF